MLGGKAEVVPGLLNVVTSRVQGWMPTGLNEAIASSIYIKRLAHRKRGAKRLTRQASHTKKGAASTSTVQCTCWTSTNVPTVAVAMAMSTRAGTPVTRQNIRASVAVCPLKKRSFRKGHTARIEDGRHRVDQGNDVRRWFQREGGHGEHAHHQQGHVGMQAAQHEPGTAGDQPTDEHHGGVQHGEGEPRHVHRPDGAQHGIVQQDARDQFDMREEERQRDGDRKAHDHGP